MQSAKLLPSDMPFTSTTSSQTTNARPNSQLESSSSTKTPEPRWIADLEAQFELRAKTHPPPRKTPSIERFLGSSHADFKPLVNSRSRIVSSLQGSEAETERPSASDSVAIASNCSTAGGPSPTPKIGSRSAPELLSSAEAPKYLDAIKTVRLPEYPIRVFRREPPPFSLEDQKSKMCWIQELFGGLGVECLQSPSTDSIQDTARPYIESISPEARTLSVTLLARGTFNIAYNITAENGSTGFHRDYIFRVSLPIWPYYKVESDVATTEFVRHATNIPVPVIYAFDSNPANELGWEWMLMERVQGRPLNDVWDTMEFDTKQHLARKIANYMAELSQYKFNKLGSIFMRYRQSHIDFYIGPSIHEQLFERDHLLHAVNRGPFDSVQALYNVILDLAEKYVNDPRHRIHALNDGENQETELNIDSSRAEMPDTHGATMPRVHVEDIENEEDCGVSDYMQRLAPGEIQKYKTMLPQLFALLPATEPLVTFLMHPDLRYANIFVDNANALVAIIDWERARLEPSAHVNFIPKFLDNDGESDSFYVPSRAAVSGLKSLYLYDHDDIALIRGMFESSYLSKMCNIQRTRLRTVYRDEMIRLKSPLCDRDPEDLELELMCRVYWPDMPGHTSATYWMSKYVDVSVFDDSDGDTEQEDEAESAEDD